MMQLLINNYLVYKVKGTNLYAAVSPTFQRDIRQFATEYQCLSAVPAERKISAVLFRNSDEHNYELLRQGQEVMVPVNRLEFDTGNLRLSA